ncbi:MAG: formate-dependent phosphoribosylglycinamide formyltransferase [Gammaproteobacteria bacterium]|nr:formate-dependent phosphoribosylglycinamide formyltransferase [Gammaproteobacteria bacterium]
MIIGTPLAANSKKVMLLGSGELGKEFVIALQRLGMEVVAVDRYPGAPGYAVAHRAHTINMLDGKALRALINEEMPHIIVPEIEAIATDTLAEIESEGLVEIIPTAKAVQYTLNREGIRRLAAETLELRTSRYAFADNLKQLQVTIDSDVGYPCIVKPVMSSSGKGQSLVEVSGDIEKAWHYAMNAGRVKGGRVIAEEKIDFDFEITLLTIRACNKNGVVVTYFCDPVGHIQTAGDYVESWQPQPMSGKALRHAQQMAKKVTDSLGGRGLFGVELFVKGDDVWFNEVSPRPHDTGMVTMVSQYQSEFALHARAILGFPVDTRLRTPGASAVIYGGFNGAPIAYDGVAEALQDPQVEIRLFGKPEAYVKRRMGVALAFGHDTTNARERANRAANCVKCRKAIFSD